LGAHDSISARTGVITLEDHKPTGSSTSGGKTSTFQIVSIGCAIAIFVGLCLCLTLAASSFGLLAYLGGEPEGLNVQYDLPYNVHVRDEFDLVLSLTNISEHPIHVSDICLDGALSASILDGAVVVSTDPSMSRDYSVQGIKTFNYDSIIQPGDTITVRFHLQAQTPGEFSGPILIYVGNRSMLLSPVITILE